MKNNSLLKSCSLNVCSSISFFVYNSINENIFNNVINNKRGITTATVYLPVYSVFDGGIIRSVNSFLANFILTKK